MNEQPKFDFGGPTTGSLNAYVLAILDSGEWYMPFEICKRILAIHQTMVSDASVTARIRDLRKSKFGSHVIDKRIREGSRAYEYKLMK